MQSSATASAVNPRPFTERNPALLPVWLLLTVNIYWVFWAYRTYQEIRQHVPSATTITPGRAVGFLFIPFFNIFWFFRLMADLPRALRRVQAQCAPPTEPLANGHLSCMLVAGLVFNVLGGSVHPALFVAGEILLASAFVVMQARMNEHNRAHQGVPAPREKQESFAGLVGAGGAGFDWMRVGAFFMATLLSFLVINVGTRWIVGGGFGFDWRAGVSAVSWTLLTTTGAVLAFRYLRNEWLAAVAAAAVFAVGMNIVWTLLMNARPTASSVAGNFAGQFLLFGSLVLFLRVARPVALAVLLGALVSEFGDNVLTLLWTGETWWASLEAWMRSSPEPGSVAWISARLEMLRPFWTWGRPACLQP
jgi:hypothetical protein